MGWLKPVFLSKNTSIYLNKRDIWSGIGWAGLSQRERGERPAYGKKGLAF